MRHADAVAALAGRERIVVSPARAVRSEGRIGAESRGVADAELESLGAAVFGVAAEGVATGEAVAAEGALVVAGFEVDLPRRVSYVVKVGEIWRWGTYAIVMSIEVGLALELLRAGIVTHHCGTRVRVLALGIVRLEVGFPVVAALEELAAYATLVRRLFRGRPLALLLDASATWKNRLHIESGQATVRAGVEFGDVARGVGFRPFGWLCAVEIFGLSCQWVGIALIGEWALRGETTLENVLVARILVPVTTCFFDLDSWGIGAVGAALRVCF